MKRHIRYFQYLIRHKKFVYKAGRKLGVPAFQLLAHDASKFLPNEWIPYSRHFYNLDGSKKFESRDLDFDNAWNRHIHKNKHHWQYWILTYDDGTTRALEMPRKYVLEMLADWIGAGLAINGKNDVLQWWNVRKDKMYLHDNTRQAITVLLLSNYDKF